MTPWKHFQIYFYSNTHHPPEAQEDVHPAKQKSDGEGERCLCLVFWALGNRYLNIWVRNKISQGQCAECKSGLLFSSWIFGMQNPNLDKFLCSLATFYRNPLPPKKAYTWEIHRYELSMTITLIMIPTFYLPGAHGHVHWGPNGHGLWSSRHTANWWRGRPGGSVCEHFLLIWP